MTQVAQVRDDALHNIKGYEFINIAEAPNNTHAINSKNKKYKLTLSDEFLY
jgi:hypothetical protein